MRFLAFDCLVIDDQNVMSRTLDKRYGVCSFRPEDGQPFDETFIEIDRVVLQTLRKDDTRSPTYDGITAICVCHCLQSWHGPL